MDIKPEKPQRSSKSPTKKHPVYVVEDNIYNKIIENSIIKENKSFDKNSINEKIISKAFYSPPLSCISSPDNNLQQLSDMTLKNISDVNDEDLKDFTKEKLATEHSHPDIDIISTEGIYSVVNKSKKPETISTCNNINNILVSAPKKPPRTFAHDEYMEIKGLRQISTPSSDPEINTIKQTDTEQSSLNNLSIYNLESDLNFSDKISIDSDYAEIDLCNPNLKKNVLDCAGDIYCSIEEVVEDKCKNEEIKKSITPIRPPQPKIIRRRTTTTSSDEFLEQSNLQRGTDQRSSERSSLNLNDKKKFDGRFKKENLFDKQTNNARSSLRLPTTINFSKVFNGNISPKSKSSRDSFIINKIAREKVTDAFINQNIYDNPLNLDSSLTCNKEFKKEMNEHLLIIQEKNYKRTANYIENLSIKTSPIFLNIFILNSHIDEKTIKVKLRYPNKILFNIDYQVVENICFAFNNSKTLLPEWEPYYCRLHLPNDDYVYLYCFTYFIGCENKLLENICLLSHFWNPSFYGKLLQELKTSKTVNPELTDNIIRKLCTMNFSTSTEDFYVALESGLCCLKFKTTNCNEISLSNSSCCELINFKPCDLLSILSIVMFESQIIVISSDQRKAAKGCIFLEKLLYPFHWQHLFLPVFSLPMLPLIYNQCSFIIGMLSSQINDLKQSQFDTSKVCFINLDDTNITNHTSFNLLPQKCYLVMENILGQEYDSQELKEAVTLEVFLNMFVLTCGNFRTYMCTQQDGQVIFQLDSFNKSSDNRDISEFLEIFTMTQMFKVFIAQEINNIKHEVFLERICCLERRNEDEDASAFKKNIFQMGRKFKDAVTDSKKIKKKL